MRPRILLPAAGALIVALAFANPAQAAEGPWCTSQPAGPGGLIENCQFHSFEQCRREVVSGNRGVCTQNPRWPGWWEQHAQRRSRR